MNEQLKNKYCIDKESKESLLLIGKRFLRVMCIVLFIKGIRIFLIKNEHVRETVNSIFLKLDMENFLKIISVQFMILGMIAVIGGYLIKGISIINNKFFNYIIFLCFIDLVLVYIFPEIYVSVAKLIFIK
ncbi:hypothetical protein [Bacillus mycoides]|uniref:Uncharacterized protein n=1 Tax=Bacillus mycoides TaxID=1405 RepID=A0ABC9QVU4_BACMY|nr:hypothetical protein [Bacillus mycoides]EJR29162.1 hypothetical protein III_05967 [Bacillus mycoides]